MLAGAVLATNLAHRLLDRPAVEQHARSSRGRTTVITSPTCGSADLSRVGSAVTTAGVASAASEADHGDKR